MAGLNTGVSDEALNAAKNKLKLEILSTVSTLHLKLSNSFLPDNILFETPSIVKYLRILDILKSCN